MIKIIENKPIKDDITDEKSQTILIHVSENGVVYKHYIGNIDSELTIDQIQTYLDNHEQEILEEAKIHGKEATQEEVVKASFKDILLSVENWYRWNTAQLTDWHETNIEIPLENAPTITPQNIIQVVEGLIDVIKYLALESKNNSKVTLALRNYLYQENVSEE